MGRVNVFKVRRMGRPALALAFYQTRAGNGRRGVIGLIPGMNTDQLAAAVIEAYEARNSKQRRRTVSNSA
jgi:hypothetical protein